MECERKSHRCDEPHVGPRRHGDERLILRQAIEKRRFYYNSEIAILMQDILQMFSHLFMAFNISIVTNTERAIVMG